MAPGPDQNPEHADKPRLIGDYFIHRVLGEGGMGTVYEAEERLSHRRVALKVLHRELSTSEGARRHFLTEMAILSRLDDPYIVRCLHCTEVDGVPLMALELLDGRTLREVLRERGALTWTEVIGYAWQIASALQSAHASEPPIIHRDLKPENVMCLDGGQLKVMDFGIGKILEANANQTSHAMGTLLYMSPEQIDARPLDVRSDLYSLGVVLWEVLAGRPPFESESPRVLLERICTERAAPLPEPARQHTPPALQQLVARLLEKDPEHRPASVLEVIAVLESLGATAPQLSPASVPAPALPAPAPPAPASGWNPAAASPQPVHPTAPTPFVQTPAPAPAHYDTLAIVERAEPAQGSKVKVIALASGLVLVVGLALVWAASNSSSSPTPADASASPASPAAPPVTEKAEAKEPAAPTVECSPAKLEAWRGSWRLDTVSTKAIKANWIGGKSRYEVDLRVEGCGLLGRGSRFVRDKKTWSFTAKGEVQTDGSVVIGYEVAGRNLDGTWVIAPSKTGTWASNAGDVSGTLTAIKTDAG